MLIKKDYPVVLAMIQPEPCPGSYLNNGMKIEEIIERSLEEVKILQDCGYDGYIVQNRNDAPVKQHAQPQNIAYMTALACRLKKEYPKMIQGILVNWDGVASLAVADASGADFVRVEHTFTGVEVGYAGFMEAQCVDICEFRKKINTSVPVYADIQEIHYEQIGKKSLKEAARDLVQNAFADGIFVGGKDAKESIYMAEQVRHMVGVDIPILLSSGANLENISEILTVFDGVSVGTWIKNGNMRNPIDSKKAKEFCERAKNVDKSRIEKNGLII